MLNSPLLIPFLGGIYLLGINIILRVFQLKSSDKTAV